MNALHICHVLQSLDPGGLENGVVNVVNGLCPTQFRSSVFCLKSIGEFANRIADKNVPVRAFLWRAGLSPLLVIRLVVALRQLRPDVVHTRNAEAFYYGFLAAKLSGVPVVVHSEHGRTFEDRKIRFFVQRLFSHSTNRIFAVTEQLKLDIQKHIGIPAHRIEVLYNGVDLGKFSDKDGSEMRQSLGIGKDVFLIGGVGRLVAVKNYALVLAALARLKNRQIAFMLVGDGPERENLERQARLLGLEGCVYFLGHREDVADCLAAMDTFVLPSTSEGMSNTLLEAMGAGIPVIASNIGGNPEIVSSSDVGLLFQSADSDALAEAIQQLMSQPKLRQELSVAGRQLVNDKFSLTAMVQRYENLYRSACARKSLAKS